ncbi:hypothetical protein R6Q59_034866 [Mikania micrantha]
MSESDSGSKSSKPTSSDSGSGSDSDSPNVVKKANSSPAKGKRRLEFQLSIEKDAKKSKNNTAVEKPKKSLIRQLEAPEISSSGSEETGSGTDSDLPPTKSNLVDSHSKSVKKSKPIATPPPSPTIRKPPARTAKKNTNDNSKMQPFRRLWSEDDEIVVLKRYIDFKAEKNEGSVDMGEFYEFVKTALNTDVTRKQLADKIRKLKRKYLNNASRDKDGEDPNISNTHEQQIYQLSQVIWGNNINVSESKKNHAEKNDNVAGMDNERQKSKIEVKKKNNGCQFIRYSGLNDSLILTEEIVKGGLELADDSKRAELDEKRKELKEQEIMVYLKRLEFLKDQALVALEAIRSSGN